MENLNLILPEIFISLAIMLFLIIGVFKKRSSSLIYNLTTISLVILLAIVFNLNSKLHFYSNLDFDFNLELNFRLSLNFCYSSSSFLFSSIWIYLK